jgi:hypothetical protein
MKPENTIIVRRGIRIITCLIELSADIVTDSITEKTLASHSGLATLTSKQSSNLEMLHSLVNSPVVNREYCVAKRTWWLATFANYSEHVV